MRVSEWFHLSCDQAELDFLDIDVRDDKRLFVDPHALRLARTPWAMRGARQVGAFFSHLLSLIRSGDTDGAYHILCYLLEPNETHLGYSVAKSRGHALGPETAQIVLTALMHSKAVQTGIVRDLEDTALLITGIDKDIVSDMTTNIIRGLLVEYTQQMCEHYGISTTAQPAGALWDEGTLAWRLDVTAALPAGPDGALLFVPKVAARVTSEIQREDFHRHVITPALQEEEIAAGSELVRLAKSGAPTVKKGDIDRKYGTRKATTIDVTQRRPELLDVFRRTRGDRMQRVPSQEQLAKALGSAAPDFLRIVGRVVATPHGEAGQQMYSTGVFRFFNALLHPNVTAPAQLWVADGLAGLRFEVITAADGPLSAVLENAPITRVHAIAWNETLDVAAAHSLVARSRERHNDNELLIIATRSHADDARAVITDAFSDMPVILLDDEKLRAAAEARQARDIGMLSYVLAVAA